MMSTIHTHAHKDARNHIHPTIDGPNKQTRVVIIGSGTCAPTPDRGAPSNYIELDKKCFMVDGGSGSLQALARAGIDYATLDGIFYTHFHPDHIGGLMPLIQALLWDPSLKRTKDFTIYGPIGLQKHVDGLRLLFEEYNNPKTFKMIIHEVEHLDEIIFDQSNVKAYYVPHTANSLGYRFTNAHGSVVSFSGDTGYGEEVIALAKDADLAIFECSWTEEYYNQVPFPGSIAGLIIQKLTKLFNIKNKRHLTATLAGELAQQANVKKLVLTHLYPETDKAPLEERCAAVFSGEIAIARDFDTFTLHGETQSVNQSRQ